MSYGPFLDELDSDDEFYEADIQPSREDEVRTAKCKLLEAVASLLALGEDVSGYVDPEAVKIAQAINALWADQIDRSVQ